MAYLEVEGSRRIYFEHHEGDGTPVVLVHGWGATGRCWDTVAPALRAAGHEVVIVDLRACGRSDNDFSDVSIAALGADVALLCQRLSLRRPVLNGWSLGGAVVVDAASRLGENLGGLVLTGGATPRYTSTSDWPHGGTVADVQGVLDGLAADRATTLKGVAGAVCAKPVGDEVVVWLWGMFLEMGPCGDDSLRDLAEIDQRKTLGAVTAPALFLHGTDDGFTAHSGAEAAVELCSDARLVSFPGCGHAPFLEDRDAYLAELTGFLNR
ncbi:pimeloyl-[acyl-carrier protein] methyl ester esterase [Prauserella aidingensis]|uniref:alpha/beta fold hydrolase n=1 Tax=Prauserella aidingensis TaxID=387890 RepID=UPI0020A605C1|nr:alpha/beta hydrolase [Prauserella aidingensis]MCP2253776.1 pimeloyl-[acyl-carrier protein] methyl ester esterase [Prauserella aidingensis]